MSPAQVVLFYLTRKVALDKTAAVWSSLANSARGSALPLAVGGTIAGASTIYDASKGRSFDPANSAALGILGGLITSKGTVRGLKGGRYGDALNELKAAQKSGNLGDLSNSPAAWKPDTANPGHFVHKYIDPELKTEQTLSTLRPDKAIKTLEPLSSEVSGNTLTKNVGIKAGLGLGVEAHHLLSGGSKIVDDSSKKINDTLSHAANTMGNIEKVTSDVALTGERASRGIEDLGATSKKMGDFFTSPWAKGAIVATGGLATVGLAYMLYKALSSNEPESEPQAARAPRSSSGGKRMRYAPADHTHDTPKSETSA